MHLRMSAEMSMQQGVKQWRDGGVCVTTNGVAVHLPRELSSEINDEQFKMTRPLNRNNVNVV